MDHKNPENRAVVVTGASSGIGRACVLRFAQMGFRVLAGVRKASDRAALKLEAGANVEPLIMDVTDPPSLHAAAARAAEILGDAGLTGLVNNAGIVVAGPLEFLPIENLRRQFEVNTIGPVAVAQAFLPLLRKGRGRIVNIGSISGLVSTPFLGPYAASKFAVEALTASMRMELAPWGIHVSVVDPGSMKTPIWEKSRAEGDSLERDLTERGRALYGRQLETLRKLTAHIAERAEPVELVVRAVEHALTSPKPKRRYVVGRGARMQALAARLAPAWIVERAILKTMRMGKLSEIPPGEK